MTFIVNHNTKYPDLLRHFKNSEDSLKNVRGKKKHWTTFSIFKKLMKKIACFHVTKHVLMRISLKGVCREYCDLAQIWYFTSIVYVLPKVKLNKVEKSEIEKRKKNHCRQKQSHPSIGFVADFTAAPCELIGGQQWRVTPPDTDVLIHNLYQVRGSQKRGFGHTGRRSNVTGFCRGDSDGGRPCEAGGRWIGLTNVGCRWDD